jgi:hypothetical protein
MARARTVSTERVPYRTDSYIEDEAQQLISDWFARKGESATWPIPVEDIIEFQLELAFYIADLQAELGHPDVLGGIWFGSREIKVDKSLEYEENPKMRGRFNFTLAHEVGHWCLHKHVLAADPTAMYLFEKNSEPAFVCRSSTKPREEIQADMFAGYLLMPRQMVYDAWQAWRGNDDPVRIGDLPIGNYHGNLEADRNMAMDVFAKPLAELFHVSAQAMRIRLQKLELLVEEITPKLF